MSWPLMSENKESLNRSQCVSINNKESYTVPTEEVGATYFPYFDTRC